MLHLRNLLVSGGLALLAIDLVKSANSSFQLDTMSELTDDLLQVMMSAAPAGFTVEYSTPGNPAIIHAV